MLEKIRKKEKTVQCWFG